MHVLACRNVSSAPLNRNTTGDDSRMAGFATSTRASSSSTPTQEAQSEAPAWDGGAMLNGRFAKHDRC